MRERWGGPSIFILVIPLAMRIEWGRPCSLLHEKDIRLALYVESILRRIER